jgi:hypothetical protein
MTVLQPISSESSETASIVAAHVKEAIRLATQGKMKCLSVEPDGVTFVLKGSCGAFYLRKEAIDAAKLQLCDALKKRLIGSASLTDLIEVK